LVAVGTMWSNHHGRGKAVSHDPRCQSDLVAPSFYEKIMSELQVCDTLHLEEGIDINLII